jgi:glycerol-3-phosphate acyltransferase PlsY
MSPVSWQAVAASAVAGYAIGSLSPAAAAARLRGADLRGTGSGNPGATNAARTMGTKVGVAVGVLDVAKGYAPVWYFRRHGSPCGQVAGLAAVLGHITSPLLKGRGGKGVATSLGSILALEPIWAIPVLTAFGTTVALTHQVGIGSVVGSMTLVPTSIVLWDGWAGVAFAVGMSGLVVYRHRRNVRGFVALRRSGPVAADRGSEEASGVPVAAGEGSEAASGVPVAVVTEAPADRAAPRS